MGRAAFDQFGQSSEDLVVLEQLLASPPEKFLELGTDHLLTGLFRRVEGRVEGSLGMGARRE